MVPIDDWIALYEDWPPTRSSTYINIHYIYPFASNILSVAWYLMTVIEIVIILVVVKLLSVMISTLSIIVGRLPETRIHKESRSHTLLNQPLFLWFWSLYFFSKAFVHGANALLRKLYIWKVHQWQDQLKWSRLYRLKFIHADTYNTIMGRFMSMMAITRSHWWLVRTSDTGKKVHASSYTSCNDWNTRYVMTFKLRQCSNPVIYVMQSVIW